MRKIFLIFSLVLGLIFVKPVGAQNIKTPLKDTKKLDFSEIILNKDEPIEVSVPTGIAADASFGNEALAAKDNPQSSDISLEDKKVTSQEKEKSFFSIFDLKGGIKKFDDAVENNVDKFIKPGTEKSAVKQWLDGDYAAGRCFGARPLFENHGVTINSSLLYSPFVKTGGGANGDPSGKGYSIFNLGINIDTEKAGLWKGGTFFGLYQRKNGYGISGPDNAMGDYMGFDGWDWRQMSQISEYWYQQKLFNNKLRVKFGKQDVNTDFGYLNSGWDFMNSGFSVNPTTPMPTYPDPGFGFMAEVNPTEWLSIRDGVYSRFGAPFNITELEVKHSTKQLPGRYMMGAWELSDSDGMSVGVGMNPDGSTYYNNFNRNFGWYVGFEQIIYREKKDDKNDMQGLAVFGQFGMSPSNKNDMSQFVAGGLHYLGPFPKRNKDIAGIAIGSGNFASRLGDVGADCGSRIGRETVVEAFYRLQVNHWFYLQPDVQFIINPGGMYNNSVAIGLRSVITF